jgi:hypothetical protein
MKPLICLVTFSGSKNAYQYRTLMTDLIEGDNLVVQARGDWEWAIFKEYIKKPVITLEITKYVVAKIDPSTASVIQGIQVEEDICPMCGEPGCPGGRSCPEDSLLDPYGDNLPEVPPDERVRLF